MDWRIRQTVACMQRDLAMPLRLPTLARRVNLSPSRFSHLFRKETGQSPARYLHELRLDSALMLLYDSTLSIKEVMAAVGFNDPSHFTKDFSRRHGVSPREFRDRSRGGSECPEIIVTQSSSTYGQETAATANNPLRRAVRLAAMFETWRDQRAKGA
jgi:transcriptional regulator GlxA family with amidase domain